MNSQTFSLLELKQKAEQFCAYQERCHKEVIQRLYQWRATPEEQNEIVVHLIQNNFLNEERFAQSFARGKHRIKKYGKVRIVNELKIRGISNYNIQKALEEISDQAYQQAFNELSERAWHSIKEKNELKKKKKFCDYLFRKGYESDLIYTAWNEFLKSK